MTGKVVTLKAVTNVQTKVHQFSDRNNLEASVQRLRHIDGIHFND